ncbi:MAG: DrmE family protein [Candidatus Odinarchaeota archaeon]
MADQIFNEKELCIAYPCLGCRGGLSLFLAYLMQSAHTEKTGRPFDPIIVYPGTTEIRESYFSITIRVGDLLEALKKIRIVAHSKGGSPRVYPWEDKLRKKVHKGKIKPSDRCPLHDFFPAAVLSGDYEPIIRRGRHSFGRGDESVPPLHFAAKINHIPSDVHYRAALLMHDALNTHAERRRLAENLGKVRASTVIHLFESPFSPNFRKLTGKGIKYWRIRPADFPEDGELFLEDTEVLGIMDAEYRIHSLPPLLDEADQKALYDDFDHLRSSAKRDAAVSDVYRRLYNLYRFVLTMPVPIAIYDELAMEYGYSTVRERLEDIKQCASTLGPTDYAYFDDSVNRIINMTDTNEEDPARSRAIISEVSRAKERSHRVGIIVTNEFFGSVIERFVAASNRTDPMLLPSLGIHVFHVSSLRTMDPDRALDVMVFPSYRGGNTLRWVMCGKANESVVICSDSERRAMIRDFRQGTEGPNSWTPVRSEPPMPLEENPEERLSSAIGDADRSLPTLPLDDETYVQGLFEFVPSSSPDVSKGAGPISCVRVVFSDRYAFLPKEGAVTVMKGKKTDEKAVTDLRPGDIVLFVNHAQSKTIYDVMLDEIKRSPGFEPYVVIIQQWHRRLKSWFAKSNLSYASLHFVLSEIGSKRVTATVASWVRGNTIAPLDPKDLKRLLLVVGIKDEDGSICKMINNAAVRLRKVYRAYARAVNAFLLKAAGEDRPEIDDLLQKYNLDISAIRESVIQEKVVSVTGEIMNISSGMAGRLYGS